MTSLAAIFTRARIERVRGLIRRRVDEASHGLIDAAAIERDRVLIGVTVAAPRRLMASGTGGRIAPRGRSVAALEVARMRPGLDRLQRIARELEVARLAAELLKVFDMAAVRAALHRRKLGPGHRRRH